VLVNLRSSTGTASVILFTKGCDEIYFKEILFFSSGIRHFRMKSLRSSDKFLRIEMLFLFIYSISCF